MAYCPSRVDKYGYDSSRFESTVDENLHCSICYNVLKEPRTCRNNDHVFCLSCITEHLNVNRQNCPECDEHLTVDTLRRPRVLNNILSKLKINCDYANRGCPEFTYVEDLETHVENCGYAPVLCSNENCGMEIDKRERVHHETKACEFRKVNPPDCNRMQGIIQEDIPGVLKEQFIELNENVEATNREMKNNHVQIKKIVGTLEGSLMRINKRTNEKVEIIHEKVETLNDFQSETNREVRKAVEGVREEVQNLKGDIFKVRKDVDDVKVMMSQMIEKLNILEAVRLLSTADESSKEQRENILIAGGTGNVGYTTRTEIFLWQKNAWVELSPMNENHLSASSFIYNGQIFVVAGEDNKTIETIDLNQLPLKWMIFPGELSYKCDDHQTVVCKQRVFHIGGYIFDEEFSNTISELSLTSAYTMKELCQMPEPRQCHGAEVFEGKVLILGGENSFEDDGVLNTVLYFDPEKNECIEMPPLPHPLMRMATVRWKDQVVMLGGCDKNRQAVNDVFLYDSKTGKITVLPSMLEKRCDCCAIFTSNTIVVMGGWKVNRQPVNSVESFIMGGYAWEYLPAMNKASFGAVAEVLPAIKKYV